MPEQIAIVPSEFEIALVLEGTDDAEHDYTLYFLWQPKCSMWLLRLFVDDDDLIASSFLELDQPLLGGNSHPKRPRGEFWSTYARQTVVDGHADFGIPCKLLYVPSDEVQNLAMAATPRGCR